MKKMIFGICMMLALVAGPVWATCECLHSPCEIQQCPPEDANVFMDVEVNGQQFANDAGGIVVTSNGHTATLRLDGIGVVYDYEGDGVMAPNVNVTGSDPDTQVTVRAVVKAYDKNAQGQWVYHSTEYDSDLITVFSGGGEGYSVYNNSVACQSEGPCNRRDVLKQSRVQQSLQGSVGGLFPSVSGSGNGTVYL